MSRLTVGTDVVVGGGAGVTRRLRRAGESVLEVERPEPSIGEAPAGVVSLNVSNPLVSDGCAAQSR